MPHDLTDADRATIRTAWDNHGDLPPPEAVFKAGLAEGRALAIEECAKVCEGPMSNYCEDGSSFAAAIRALK